MATFSTPAQSTALRSYWTVGYYMGGYYTASGPNTATATLTFSFDGIPSGSLINSATLYCTHEYGSSGAKTINGAGVSASPCSLAISGVTGGGSVGVNFSYTGSGAPGTSTGTKSSNWDITSAYITVDYTSPYTNPSVWGASVGSQYLAPGASTTLSWLAAHGDYNQISSYTVEYQDNDGGWGAWTSNYGSQSLSAQAPAGGSYRRWRIIAIAPHGNSAWTYSPYVYSYTAPSVSSVLLDYSGGNQYRGAGAWVLLSWTGGNGSYNNVTSYLVQRSDNGGEYYTISVGSGGSVAAPGAGQYSRFRVLAYGQYSNSDYSYSPYLYAYSAVTAPTGVTLSPTSCAPGSSVTLSWGSSSNGVGVSVTGYHVYEDGVYKANPTGTVYVFTAPGDGNHSYVVYGIGSVSGYNSGASSAATLNVGIPKSTGALNKSSVEMDDTSTIALTISAYNTSLTHKALWYIPNKSGSVEQTIAAGVTTATLTVPVAWISHFPSATYGTGWVKLSTYNGATLLGENSYSYQVIVPATVVPTVSVDVASVSGFGAYYLRNITKCRVTPTMGGVYGSSIVSWYAYGGGYSSATLYPATTYWDTGSLTVVGTNNMTVTVTDSRGRTTTATNSTVSVTDYAVPLIHTHSAKRCDVNGNLLNTGTYIKVTASVAEAELIGNSIDSFTVKHRESGGTYGTAEDLTEGVGLIIGANAIDIAKAYDVFISATDTVGYTATAVIKVNPSEFLFEFKNDRAGVGRLADPSVAKSFSIPTDWTTNITPAQVGAAAASHPHGNITSDGKVGTTADQTLMTGTGGLVVAKTMAEAIAIWKFTNPNILHNWDFRDTPVNQRGSTGAISTGYFYDRWMRYAGTITINATYLSMPANASIEQRIEGHGLSGKAVTVSVMVGDAVISGQGTFPTSAGTAAVTLTGFGTATLGYHADYMFMRITAADSTRQLQAGKLELGTVSTLAYDPPMDYGTELAKCQRYFVVFYGGGAYDVYATGFTSTATNGDFLINAPVRMRIKPSVAYAGKINLFTGANTSATITGMTAPYMTNTCIMINCDWNIALSTNAAVRIANSNDANGSIRFSADL